MTKQWSSRLIALSLGGALVEAFMVLTDMGPDVPVVAGLIATLALAMWTAADLDGAVVPIEFATRRSEPDWSMAAERATAPLRFLLYGRRNADAAERLHDALVDLVDRQLLTVHGIDRHTRPDDARRALSPTLQRFVDSSPPPVDLTQVSELDRIVSEIESMAEEGSA